MRRLVQQIAPVLRLTRVTNAFAAVANAWFVVLWTRSDPALPHPGGSTGGLALDLVAAAAAAAGLYAFGSCLNDVLDARRDRLLHRDRPIGDGHASGETGVFVAASTLIISVLGATVFGTGAVIATVLLAAAILVFNAAGRFVPGVGLLLLAGIFGGHMLVPNLHLDFLWPVWLVGTHALVVLGTVHVIGQHQPRLTTRAIVFAALGWAAGTAALLTVIAVRPHVAFWPDSIPPAAAVWPAAAAACFVGLAVRRVHAHGMGPRAAEKIARYGALWMSLYAVAWFVGAGRLSSALAMGTLAIVGFVGIAVLREAYALVENPVGYQR